jgi:hypothetical protein
MEVNIIYRSVVDMVKKVKLTLVQQDIIEKMNNGWALTMNMGGKVISACWIYKRETGGDVKSHNVSWNTVNALLNKGLIIGIERFPTRYFNLASNKE